MIKWYESDKLAIFFSDIPHVCMRYVLPSSTEQEIKSIKKYPFINKKSFDVKLFDSIKEHSYGFTIHKGYCYDGASIPRAFWRLIGSNTDNSFLIPALIHDVLCEHHEYIMNDREFSSEVFNALLEVSEVGKIKRFIMKHSVNFYQRFCGWEK
ncbi:MAG: DUF1353 domain-containing protein [Methanobrevibacter sp.]|nr:DUF1353 domain-containing protein [Methanobrevibacter sp.]